MADCVFEKQVDIEFLCMYLIKLVLNRDARYMIICFDVGADVHNFSVLKYHIRSENENTLECEVTICVAICDE